MKGRCSVAIFLRTKKTKKNLTQRHKGTKKNRSRILCAFVPLGEISVIHIGAIS